MIYCGKGLENVSNESNGVEFNRRLGVPAPSGACRLRVVKITDEEECYCIACGSSDSAFLLRRTGDDCSIKNIVASLAEWNALLDHLLSGTLDSHQPIDLVIEPVPLDDPTQSPTWVVYNPGFPSRLFVSLCQEYLSLDAVLASREEWRTVLALLLPREP